MGRGGPVWGVVVVCVVRWSCVGHGGRVWGAVVMCGARVVMCGARWSCVGCSGCVWGAVVVCGWSYGRVSGFRLLGPGFKTWVISFTPLCPCLSKEMLKVVGQFYLVFMPGEVKDPTQGN